MYKKTDKLFPWEVSTTNCGFSLSLVDVGIIKYIQSFRDLADEIKCQHLHNKQNWYRIIKYQGVSFYITSHHFLNNNHCWNDGQRGILSIIFQGSTVNFTIYCNIAIPIIKNRSTRFFWNLLSYELKDICDQIIIASVHHG